MDPLRVRLLDETTRQFVERGFDGTSMREIAEACGVTKAALYYHYRSKAELLRDIVGDYLDEVAAVVRDAATEHEAAPEQLRAVLRGLFALPAQRRAVMRLAMHDLRHLPPEDQAEFGARYRARFVGPLAGILERGMDEGAFAERDPEVVVWLVLGMAYPFFSARRAEDGDVMADELLDVLLNGL